MLIPRLVKIIEKKNSIFAISLKKYDHLRIQNFDFINFLLNE